MFIDEACVSCIINQSIKVAEALHADKDLQSRLITTVEKMSKDFSYTNTPPEIAADVYEKMAQIVDKTDIYDEVKEHSTQKALSFVPFLEKKLQNTQEKLLTATKIAVAGNVIDLAAEVEFDLEEELEKIFHTEFALNDFDKLQAQLAKANQVVILGDNVGEHIFDKLFLQTLKELYPQVHYSYFVRGNPIINDVTMKEAEAAGFSSVCQLINSGVNTPGFAYSRASTEAKKVFDEADIVISKGMGNYECLSPSHRKDICFLLKIKCGVVANSLGKEVGDIVCKMA